MRRLLRLCLVGVMLAVIFGLKVSDVPAYAASADAGSTSLSDLATTLAGRDVTVECFPPDNVNGGFVYLYNGVMDTVIHLQGTDCGALQNVLTPGPRTAKWLRTFDAQETVGLAILDLAHEATHERLQSTDEGLVECTAVRNIWNSIKQLPLTWKIRQAVYRGAMDAHKAMPTTGSNSVYRSVC